MKLNFNRKFKDLDEKEIADTQMNVTLASDMVNQRVGDTIKIYELAKRIHKGEVVDLDTSDQKMLRELIETSPELTHIAKYQIYAVFDEGKI